MQLSDCIFEAPQWLQDMLDEKDLKDIRNATPWQVLQNDLYERCE